MSFSHGYALLIGVGSHKYVPKLDVPVTVADAGAVAAVLRDAQYCGYPRDQVIELHDDTATREGILGAFDRLARIAQPKDTVLIFYSGHGDYGTDGEYYLVSHDAQVKNAKVVGGSGVSQAVLLDRLRKITAQKVLVIFNACHSGEISPTLGVPDELGSKSLPNTTADALLATGSGRVIITACREGQYSYVGGGELTLFAQALVDALRGKDILPRGGAISAFDLYTAVFESVSATVSNLYKRLQEPELTVLKGVGPFAVALYRGASETNLSAAEALAEPPPGAGVRQVSPERSQRLFQQIITQIDTGGGEYVGRDKIVYGDEVHGDKVGGDKITVGDITGSTGIAIGRKAQVRISYGSSAQELEQLFQPILQAARQAPPDRQAGAVKIAEDLKGEASRGKDAEDATLAKLIEGLVGLVPAAVGAVVSAFASPLLAGIAGPVTKYVLNKIQGK